MNDVTVATVTMVTVNIVTAMESDTSVTARGDTRFISML